MKPVQMFSLVERAIKKAHAQAEIGKPAPTGRRTCRCRAAGNAEVNAKHHHRGNDGGVPKNPTPGKVVGVPALESGGDVAGKNDVRGIGRYAENDQAFRESGKNKSHGEG